jgi:hypothetical protein
MFCTSTLLEGVNMPARNIFILTPKRGQRNFAPVDFWNLAGRAGRLGKELAGNIVCVRDEAGVWKNTDLLEAKNEISVTPTITEKTEHKSLKHIQDLLEKKELRKNLSATDKEVLEHLTNIITIDTLRFKDGYTSPLFAKLINDKRDEILELAKANGVNIEVPQRILSANESIDVRIQDRVFRKVQSGDLKKLPSRIDYENCLRVLHILAKHYDWAHREPRWYKSEKQLSYYAQLMNKWINDTPLNLMIGDAISFKQRQKSDVYINRVNVGRFDQENRAHVNNIINDLLDDIEQRLRFTFERYLNHYHMLLVDKHGEDSAGANWAQYLEYGTRSNVIIALQNLGLSRHSASYIYNKHSSCLDIVDGKLLNVLTAKLISRLNPDSPEFDEAVHVFGA